MGPREPASNFENLFAVELPFLSTIPYSTAYARLHWVFAQLGQPNIKLGMIFGSTGDGGLSGKNDLLQKLSKLILNEEIRKYPQMRDLVGRSNGLWSRFSYHHYSLTPDIQAMIWLELKEFIGMRRTCAEELDGNFL